MQEAAALAGRSDVAVVVVRDYRSEHADRPSITLSNEQDLLVQAVAAANPRTIVVVASGGPVSMPWLDQVPAVLESWYGVKTPARAAGRTDRSKPTLRLCSFAVIRPW